MKKPSIQDILVSVSKIDSRLEPISQDKSRLNFIKELMECGGIDYARQLVQDLYFEPSKHFATSLISGKNNSTSIDHDSYLSRATKQNNHQIILPQPSKTIKRKNLTDYEKYEETIEYIELNKKTMTIGKKYQTKRKISKINDEKLKIILEKKLGLWQKDIKKQKQVVDKTGIYKNTSFYQTRNVKNIGK